MQSNLKKDAGSAAQNSAEPSTPTVGKNYNEFVAGYLAACTSISILYPLNKIIFRQQLHGIDANIAYKQLYSEGIAKLYRGLLPPLLQKSTSYSIMFGTQHQYYLIARSHLEHTTFIHKPYSTPILNGFSGILAGFTEAALTPLERIQAILQTEKYHDKYKNSYHAFRDIYKTYGFKELYRGLNAIALRNSLSNSIFFSLRKPLSDLFPQSKSKVNNAIYDFITGGLLGASISTLFFPLNVLKSNMQAKIGGEFVSVVAKFRIVYESRDKQISLFNKGIKGNFWRALLAWGLTNSTFEIYLNSLRDFK